MDAGLDWPPTLSEACILGLVWMSDDFGTLMDAWYDTGDVLVDVSLVVEINSISSVQRCSLLSGQKHCFGEPVGDIA